LQTGAVENVHSDNDVATFAEVDQRQCEFGIEQGRERDNDRTGGDCRARRQSPGGVLESIAGTEHRVQHPIELALPDISSEPPWTVAA